MRLFRFDEEVSIPVSRWGSRLRVGPITGDDSQVRVQVLYLPPDGSIGRHGAAARQLFAVLTGEGWVSGGDDRPTSITAGQAALWEAGEEHGAGSEHGLTAVSVEGSFEMWAAAVTQDIIVTDYDPAWPEWFERLRQYIWPAVEDVAARIEHVGSTAVPGIAAKPIIDMDVIVDSEDDVRPVIDRLATIGYRWRGDLGIPGRQAFALTSDEGLPPHHLYLVVDNCKAYLDHRLLRDLLRTDPQARERYASLKRRNAHLAENNMDTYVAAKAELVAELLTR
ncbi:MAG: GrpB family protein, partial [Acidimicrobiaceae bacterium]|nr:GrpB family protein [Acidimicrobiaceae bacterium]